MLSCYFLPAAQHRTADPLETNLRKDQGLNSEPPGATISVPRHKARAHKLILRDAMSRFPFVALPTIASSSARDV